MDKIDDLKKNIDKSKIVDPLVQLKEKMAGSKVKFELKPVTVKDVNDTMRKMKMKKSAGSDEISQECLLLGKSVLASPLTKIINDSIKEGRVPECWKEAVVVPILKKGDPKIKSNYRPVSCLITASKVMEKVVSAQVTKFLEDNAIFDS